MSPPASPPDRARLRPATEHLTLSQLQRHGRALANLHEVPAVADRRQVDRLLPALRDNARAIEDAYQRLDHATREEQPVPPAADWLLDNHTLIESQIRLARELLPKGYSRELPKLEGGAGDGLPRVYDIALELLRHADGRLDEENVVSYVGAYQSITALKLGELWAVPIVLRLALIEIIRQTAERLVQQTEDRRLAHQWAGRLTAGGGPQQTILEVAELIRQSPPLTPAFVAEYVRRLQGRVAKGSVALDWLDHRLAENGQTIDGLVTADGREQAADRVALGNCIGSLRFLESMEWKDFVEDQSRVERMLRTAPGYAAMAFVSRDRYRQIVEHVARRSPRTEEQVARVAVELAAEAAERLGRGPARTEEPDAAELRRAHVGFYLIDDGRLLLERSVGYRPPLRLRLGRAAGRHRLTWFLGSIVLGTFGWASLAALVAALLGYPQFAALLGLLFVPPASQVALMLTNWLCLRLVPPRPVQRMDYDEGIPEDCRTLVVVPTMLTGLGAADRLAADMELRYLGNRDRHVRFALLTDFADSAAETTEADDRLVARLKENLDRLNARYADSDRTPFCLLHRPRLWNGEEGKWMGRERKRGKLEDLNRLILQGRTGPFAEVTADVAWLMGVKFVVTLDTDTELPAGAAREMVAALAHPLSRPVIDPQRRVVTDGYAILQPRVGVPVAQARQSRYSLWFAGEPGVDPYTHMVSDVYQDVFAAGSFVGKGVYDVRAFETTIAGRFPDNRILSHDLVESAFARSGLLGDVVVFEGFPGRLLSDMSRRHRWVRGDWQILSWAFSRPPGRDGRYPNPLGGLARWKIFDNLRRSLVPAALLVFLVVGWLLTPAAAWAWSLAAVAVYGAVPLFAWAWGLPQLPKEMPVGMYLRGQLRTLRERVVQDGLNLAILPYEAHAYVDAVLLTLYRVYRSGAKLLQWTTSSEAERTAKNGLAVHYEVMAACTVVGVGVPAVLAIAAPAALPGAAPLCLLWLAGPLLAWWVSRPLAGIHRPLTAAERRFLRGVARRTYLFFQRRADRSTGFLAPDNFQHGPVERLADRTSPTNIGMGLLADLVAVDLGFQSVAACRDRVAAALDSVDRMEKFRGHLFNWYSASTHEVLPARYVSTVDSGNLAGHLLTLRGGLVELADAPALPAGWHAGLLDAADVLEAALPAGADVPESLRHALDLVREPPPTGPSRIVRRLDELHAAFADPPAVAGADGVSVWAEALRGQCDDLRRHLRGLAPWTDAPNPWSDWRTTLPGDCAEPLEKLTVLVEATDETLPLRQFPRHATEGIALVERLLAGCPDEAVAGDLRQLRGELEASGARATALLADLQTLAVRSSELAMAMDFTFLVDPKQKLFVIGYDVDGHRMGVGCYDLLASEARLASFFAIAAGQMPTEHWFRLGRQLTAHDGEPLLLSWSGSMFEYLMPTLVLPEPPTALLYDSCRTAVRRQIDYGRQRGVPWGISESCYNVTDTEGNYQYRAFGVPGLGLKRGLGDNLVIAPYASALALLVEPVAATRNLRRLADEGFLADEGYWEAVDYTAGRRGKDDRPAPCLTHMAHHSGMSLVAVGEVLGSDPGAAADRRPMARRLMSDPLCMAQRLLLQERVPKVLRPVYPHAGEVRESARADAAPSGIREFDTARTAVPEVHLLSNGRYHRVVSNAGGGFARWDGPHGAVQVTRWRPDAVRDDCGPRVYLRDDRSGRFWPTTGLPGPAGGAEPSRYRVSFSQGRVEFRRVQEEIDAVTVVGVSPEDDVEVRQVTLTNIGRLERHVSLTTCDEVVIAPPGADLAHRAFSNLFVQAEVLPEHNALLFTRRRRADERPPFLFHVVLAGENAVGGLSFDTDRAQFLGRGNDARDPVALHRGGALAGGPDQPATLDPVAAARQAFRLPAGGGCQLTAVTGIAATRQAALALIEKYQDYRLSERVYEVAWTHSQILLQQLAATEAQAQEFGRLAGALVYRHDGYRVGGRRARHLAPQSELWKMGIGGDHPIVLLHANREDTLDLARELVQAHAYWRRKGVVSELVIVNEDQGGYRQQVQQELLDAVAAGPDGETVVDRAGGIFVRRRDLIGEADLQLLSAVAVVELASAGGRLSTQLDRLRPGSVLPPARDVAARHQSMATPVGVGLRDLTYFNGWGGFTRDGREYVQVPSPDGPPPAPWSNVMANPRLGTVVSETGAAYTWFENAHECRLTPWHNDPVADPTGEALYLQDLTTGRYCCPTGAVTGDRAAVCRHGFGYSVWEAEWDGLHVETTVFVPIDLPAKCTVLKVANRSGRRRELAATGYVEWVLGEHRGRTGPTLTVELDAQTGALLARNPFSIDFPAVVGFFQCDAADRTLTADRMEFVGRGGSLANPAALGRERLGGTTSRTTDPCAALQASLLLEDGEEREVLFVLGAGRDAGEAHHVLGRLAAAGDARQALEEVWRFWEETLTTVYVETPDPGLNYLANGWLLYQTLSCRFWGRSAYYQSGGAFGFRDQLQDSLALLWSQAPLTREHLMRCCARQFTEGDVQHWWHPPVGRGVRTRITDDLLWLAYVACEYSQVTGDTGVWDETEPFLEAPLLGPEEESRFAAFPATERVATLYDHCRAAILRTLSMFGAHELPLIGTGDWNDGLDRVGEHGKGESVWLGFFLCEVLARFIPIAQGRGDDAHAADFVARRGKLAEALEKAWDGGWYRRAYFDDGRPLGSKSSPEAEIDALPQTWATLTGVGAPERRQTALAAVDERLVDRDLKLIRLLLPPFEGKLEPGYIRGYPPGVRENGAQYTHAAIWTAMAAAEIGDAAKAWEYFGLLSPIEHARDPASAARYVVEPYVVAADVYTLPGRGGRGGWTWYTGSAGWFHRFLLNSLLGLRLENGNRLTFRPCVPDHWEEYRISYRHYHTFYRIHCRVVGLPTHHVERVTLDGALQPDRTVPLRDDGVEHHVEVTIGVQ